MENTISTISSSRNTQDDKRYENLRSLYWKTVMNHNNNDLLNIQIEGEEKISLKSKQKTDSPYDKRNIRGNESVTMTSQTTKYDSDMMEEKFVCPVCFKTFNQKSNKTKHKKQVHDKMKPYICPENGCNKRFSQNSVKLTHYKTVHCGEKPFTCPNCFKAFSDKSNMRKHLRNIHLKEKPYVCMHCGSRFGEKRSLNDHVNCVHLKRRPYICLVSGCGKTFGQKTHLSKHQKTQH